jgi:4-amino-4-deoxy-L-arabinose transferase-like glycosyltransferase
MKPVNKTFLVFLFIIAMAITGAGLVLYVTRGGIGVQSDSAFYVGVARSLVAGHGLGLTRPTIGFEFFSIFPPLYALCLAGLDTIGLDIIAAARWMNALLFGLTIALAGSFFIWKWKAPLPAILVSALLTFSPSMISAHAWLLSEPLYYCLATVSLLALVIHLTESGWKWLIISACAAALAALDRYAGLALAAGGLIILFLQPGANLRLRLQRTTLFGLISLLPTAVWLGIARILGGSVAGRALLSPAGIGSKIAGILSSLKSTLISWVPFSADLPFISDPHKYKPFWIILILLTLALFFWTMRVIRRGEKKTTLLTRPGILLSVFLVFMVCHLLVFLGASLFLSESPSAGDRNFAPLLFSVYFILGAIFFMYISYYQENSRIRTMIYLVTGLLVVLSIAQGVRAVTAYSPDGLGYNTRNARQSPIYQAIRALPDELLIVCNDPNITLFHTDRAAYPLVEQYTLNPEWDFPVYGQGRNRTDKGQLAFDQGLAALVLLPDAYWEFELIYGDKTDQRMEGLTHGLYLYYEGPDGSIYLKDISILKK